MKKINVLISDNSEIFRIGLETALSKWLDINIVAISSEGEDTIQKAVNFKPDVILLGENINYPGCIEISRQIKHSLPDTRIILFTDNQSDTLKDPFQVFGTQAAGYVDQQTDSGNLISIIRRVTKGDFFVSPFQGKKLVEELNNLKAKVEKKPHYSFTRREKEVLKLAASGMSNREIAEKLYVSENTVKAHLTRILQKMNLQNRRQLIIEVSKNPIL